MTKSWIKCVDLTLTTSKSGKEKIVNEIIIAALCIVILDAYCIHYERYISMWHQLLSAWSIKYLFLHTLIDCQCNSRLSMYLLFLSIAFVHYNNNDDNKSTHASNWIMTLYAECGEVIGPSKVWTKFESQCTEKVDCSRDNEQ